MPYRSKIVLKQNSLIRYWWDNIKYLFSLIYPNRFYYNILVANVFQLKNLTIENIFTHTHTHLYIYIYACILVRKFCSANVTWTGELFSELISHDIIERILRVGIWQNQNAVITEALINEARFGISPNLVFIQIGWLDWRWTLATGE